MSNGSMRASLAVVIALGLAWLTMPEASAQGCCPAGCVPSGYAGGCWQNGTNNACPSIPCGQPAQGTGTGTSGSVTTPATSPPSTNSGCVSVVSPANIDVETAACVNALTASAQLFGCLFEDPVAGKKETSRTGLTCPNRQAALAKQCKDKCTQFAVDYHSHICERPLRSRDDFWQATFGSIGGQTFGSARVQDCGPKLPSRKVRVLK